MSLKDDQQRLQEFNVFIRQRLEQAESRIPHLNDLIDRVADVGLVKDVALLGDIMLQRPYSSTSGQQDTAQVLQAAVLVPGGIGAIVWDMEDCVRLKNDPEAMHQECWRRFTRFDALSLGEKALLMLYVAPLVMRLAQLMLPMVERDDGASA